MPVDKFVCFLKKGSEPAIYFQKMPDKMKAEDAKPAKEFTRTFPDKKDSKLYGSETGVCLLVGSPRVWSRRKKSRRADGREGAAGPSFEVDRAGRADEALEIPKEKLAQYTFGGELMQEVGPFG